MSYDIKPSACLVYFGVRYLSAEAFDWDADPRAKATAAHDLSTWCGRRYPPTAAGDRPFFLLVGELVCRVAYHDGSCEDAIDLPDLRDLIDSTARRLRKAGFAEVPELWVQCHFD